MFREFEVLLFCRLKSAICVSTRFPEQEPAKAQIADFCLRSEMSVTRICQRCGKSFSIPPSAAARGKGKHCSKECRHPGTIEERFWSRVDKGEPDECWNWIGGTSNSGRSGGRRGEVSINKKPERAYRFSYMLHNGSIPNGKEICHTCDNPLCVNPKHLFSGTRLDNIMDMYRKGRDNHACGERVGCAKLTKQIILEIREMLAMNIPHRVIAEKYNIDKGRVSRIKNKLLWKCVPDRENK
jgi:hypothetical protein